MLASLAHLTRADREKGLAEVVHKPQFSFGVVDTHARQAALPCIGVTSLPHAPIGVRHIVDRLSVLQGHLGYASAMPAPLHLGFDEATCPCARRPQSEDRRHGACYSRQGLPRTRERCATVCCSSAGGGLNWAADKKALLTYHKPSSRKVS